MARRPNAPEGIVARQGHGASSGDVKLDDGDRAYVAEGDLIAGKYRVERILGVGGVGFVVAARHQELGGQFALKFLKKRFLHDKAIVERFTREARAACRIKSDFVARVYDVGAHGRAPFLVMEHLVGRDLAAVLAERGAFPVSDAVEYAVQACAALAVAHASGIVHRDIKPENLFLVDEEGLPTIKLLDFGISKLALASDRPSDEWGPEGDPITGTLICGTPFYMSPEQIRSTATVDARSDVWSLGMVLYELVTATTAFRAESVADVCAAILDLEARWLCDLRPEVPPGLADVVARCLRKDPADRFGSIAEMAVALLPFAPARALAIAEGSAWIRRAAIQSVGSSSSGSDLRPSGGHRAAITSPGTSQRTPTPTPGQVSPNAHPAGWSQGRAIALAIAATFVIGAIAAWGAAHIPWGDNGKGGKPTAAPKAVEAVRATPPEPPLTAEVSSARSAPSPPSASVPTLTHPAPVASPPSAPAAPAVVSTPFRPRVAPPVRAQTSAKSAVSAPSQTTEATSTPATATPSSPPRRPDLGY